MPAQTPSLLRAWLEKFSAAMAAPDQAAWSELFVGECFWRDFVALSWNIVTLEGVAAVAAMARTQARSIG